MTLKTVRRSTLAADAARELERMIVTGEWTEGTKIPPEPELMEQLGVSRNTLREAVRALTHVGLLEARPGDGTYVRSTSVLGASMARRLTECDLRQTLETRHCLEREAVRLAAERRTDDEVTALRDGLAAMEEALAAGETAEALTRLAFAQERRLVEASHNPLLIELYDHIAEPVRTALGTVIERFTNHPDGGDWDHPKRLHRGLVDAIADGDGDAAQRILAEKSEFTSTLLEPEDT